MSTRGCVACEQACGFAARVSHLAHINETLRRLRVGGLLSTTKCGKDEANCLGAKMLNSVLKRCLISFPRILFSFFSPFSRLSSRVSSLTKS